MDVSSLYTNIDQEEGAEACYKKLEQRKHKSLPHSQKTDLIGLAMQHISIQVVILFTTKGHMHGDPDGP